MSASSGLTMSVGPAPRSRSSAVATKYTALLPQPVRWTHSTRARSSTRSVIASSWCSRNAASGLPVRRCRWSSGVERTSTTPVGRRRGRTRPLGGVRPTFRRSCSRGTGGLGAGQRVGSAVSCAADLGQLLLDRGQPASTSVDRRPRREPLVEPVDAVLDALQALRDRAHAAREALDVGGRGDVEGVVRDLLGLDGLLARLEGTRDRAAHQRVAEQVLGELAEGLLAPVCSRWRSPFMSSSVIASDSTHAVTQNRVVSPSTRG